MVGALMITLFKASLTVEVKSAIQYVAITNDAINKCIFYDIYLFLVCCRFVCFEPIDDLVDYPHALGQCCIKNGKGV